MNFVLELAGGLCTFLLNDSHFRVNTFFFKKNPKVRRHQQGTCLEQKHSVQVWVNVVEQAMKNKNVRWHRHSPAIHTTAKDQLDTFFKNQSPNTHLIAFCKSYF